MTHVNRRRPSHTRFPLCVPAVAETMGGEDRPTQGEAQDMSRSGLGLRMQATVAPDAPVRVTLRLRRRPEVTLLGKVVWVRPHPDLPGWAIGIQFGDEIRGEMVAEIADAEYPPWGDPGRR